MTLIFSEEELDALISANPDKLVVVFGALTWCRPCKGMQRPVQVGGEEGAAEEEVEGAGGGGWGVGEAEGEEEGGGGGGGGGGEEGEEKGAGLGTGVCEGEREAGSAHVLGKPHWYSHGRGSCHRGDAKSGWAVGNAVCAMLRTHTRPPTVPPQHPNRNWRSTTRTTSCL